MRILNQNITLKRSSITSDYMLFLILIIYTLLGIFLIKYYLYQINPDGINYITISKLIISGNLYDSINDYWSPLISWLLIPLLFFTKTPVASVHATKILSLIIGFFTIIGIRQLSYRFEMDDIIRAAVLFIMVPVILYFVFSEITPDLLMVCILVYYLSIIFNLDYPNKLSNGVLCGILGALSYFTKSYGFSFFIASFFILNLFQYFRDSDRFRRKKIIKNFILGFAIFLMISGIWIGLISSKDEKLTIGTAGEINYAKFGPQSHGSIYVQWSPFSSWSNFKYQIHLITYNSLKIVNILYNFSYLSLLIILAYIIMCIQPPRKLITKNEIFYPLITIFIAIGGYVFVVVEDRYIWIVNVLLILMGGYLINLLFKTDFFSKLKFRNIIKIGILLIFAFLFISMPINQLVHDAHDGDKTYKLSKTLMDKYGIHGTIASNDRVSEMYYLNYYMNTTFYGQLQNNISASELRSQLKSNNINYYFVWDSNQSYDMDGYKEITKNKIKDLKVYTLNN
jgi:hypothetical protein